MVRLRPLLNGLLIVAVAQLGVMATAPAHAHEDGAGHGVREVVLTHAATDEHDPHHDGGRSYGEENHAITDPAPLDGAKDDGSRGEHAHVHACPQFAPLDATVSVAAPQWRRHQMRLIRSSPAARHSTSPPLRPPRIL